MFCATAWVHHFGPVPAPGKDDHFGEYWKNQKGVR
jgi:hypothetical protein